MSSTAAKLRAIAAGLAIPATLIMPGAAAGDNVGTALPGGVAEQQVAGSEIIDRVQLPTGQTQTTVRTGPIPVQAHTEDGSGDDPHDMHGTHTTVLLPWIPPCVNCYITEIKPDLTYADGSTANYDTGVMLHHTVVFDRSKPDVTCGGSGTFYELTGQRVFASGNERTGGELPAGYGVKLDWLPLTWGVVELMNMAPEPQLVYVDATITHVPANTPGMRAVTPIWLDAANCSSDSLHHVPEGESVTQWQWDSTISGTFVAAGGHLHDGGQMLTLSNATTGEEICPSMAGYDNDPAYMGHIDTMSTCIGENLGTVREGETLQLDSHYHTHHAQHDVMSIMMAFVDASG